MTITENRTELIEFAITTAGKLARRTEHRPEFAGLDAEDISQELVLYVLECAGQFDPRKGNHEAFVNRMLKSGIGKMLREAGRKRSRPPEGMTIESFAAVKELRNGLPEELFRSVSAADRDRRTLRVSRDPIDDFDLTEAVQRQIALLPRGYRKIARQLMESNRTESAKSLGISKRKFAEAVVLITEHFAGADWINN